MGTLYRVIPELAQRITGMMNDAQKEGLALSINTGFRPLADQQRLYKAYKLDPAHNARAAIPGRSNHGKVVNGVQVDSTAVDLDCVDPTPANQAHHLKLAQRWGMYRAVVGEYWHLELAANRQPIPAPPTTQEDGMADRLVIEYANGAKTVAKSDGGIFNAGTPFFGSMNDLPSDKKRGFEEAFVLTPVNALDAGAGYIIWAQNGNQYKFDPAFWKSLGH